MKELVLIFSPSLPASKKLITNQDFLKLIKFISQHVPVRNVVVEDEKTRALLIKVKRNCIPLLLIDTGEDVMEIKRVSFIMKFLTDLESNIKAHSNKKPQYEEELVTPVYKNVFFIECSKSSDVQFSKFDSVIISETCKKVHFEDSSVTFVDTTNLSSMKKILNLLSENKKLLIISKDKRLADIVVALVMFHVEKKSLAETEKSINTIFKKPLRDLFTRASDTIPSEWEDSENNL